MRLELDKSDLVSLVKGSVPNYSVMEKPLISISGIYNGSYDKWEWNYKFEEKLTEQELLDMYILCRDSWK